MEDTFIVSLFFTGFALIASYGGSVSKRQARVSRWYLGPLLPRADRKTPTPSSTLEARPRLRLVAATPPAATRTPEVQCA
jgi:hypothetical protein